jgi:hypothetical protein
MASSGYFGRVPPVGYFWSQSLRSRDFRSGLGTCEVWVLWPPEAGLVFSVGVLWGAVLSSGVP